MILIIGENNKEKQQVSIQSLSKQENFNPKNIIDLEDILREIPDEVANMQLPDPYNFCRK